MISDDESYHSANESNNSINDSFCSLTDTLGDFVRGSFNKKSNQLLNVCHINAQSIPSHYSDLSETFANANVHAILVSESWLKPLLPSTTYPLSGFVLIRNDRVERRGGGVAIYLRSDLTYKTLASSSSSNASAEYLFLEVSVKGIKIILGVVYCPPLVDYFSSVETTLESLGSEYAHHIIMGDFNTNLLNHHSSRSRKLLQIIESSSLQVLPLQATHHNIDGDDTWLDLILTSAPSLVANHGQHPAPGFSHHDLIFLSYILKPPRPIPKVLSMRCFARMDVSKLHKDAGYVNWDLLKTCATIDKKVEVFNNAVLDLYNVHAPVRRVKLKRLPAPWITEGIRMAMRRRDRAFRKFKKERSDDNWTMYKAARNRCNQLIRNAKRRHILNNISSSSSANIWKFLGTLGIGKQRNTNPQWTIGLDDINNHFASTNLLDHHTKCSTVAYLDSLSRPNIDPFKFSSVTPAEIKKIILSLKSNAVGCDDISRRMIITILDHLLLPIAHIINFSLESSSFPSLWCKAYVLPLPKIPNPSLPNHFRPISILPFLSKVLEACVHKQLSGFIFQNDLLSPYQSGFRPGHSTTSALLKVTGDIRAGMEDTKVTVLALVDFSNAFNTVNHEILMSILSYLNISTDALNWFSTYLSGRQQSVRHDDSSSKWRNLHSGVPQGGILSPLLFSVFINLLTNNLQCAYHLYADDLQLYVQSGVDSVSSAIDQVNLDLNEIQNWSERFGVSVNPSKCQAIVVGSQRMMTKINLDTLPPIKYDQRTVHFCPVVKNLGLYIDSNMNWKVHITNVSQRVTGSLRSLYRLKNFLPSTTKLMLVQALILPVIDYGDVCYFDLNADLLNKIDRLLNNCIRFVFNLRKYDHVSTYRSELKWLPIRYRRNLRALTTLFTFLNSPSPPSYLTPYLQYLCSQHDKNLRSSNNRLLLCPSHNSGFVNSSFFVQSVLLWNALPLELRMCTNRLSFKQKVRDLMFDKLAESSHL